MPTRTFTYAAIGFATGFMLAMFALAFTGSLPNGPADDLNQTALDKRTLSIRIALVVGVIASIFATMAGEKKVSKYWAYFTIVFWIIAIIPVWPGKSGTLLPLATPYVNFGFDIQDLVLLTSHVLAAGFITYLLRKFWSNRQPSSGEPNNKPLDTKCSVCRIDLR